MNRPHLKPDESVRPQNPDLHGYVSCPTKYFNRPSHPTDYSNLAVRFVPAAVQSEQGLQTKNTSSTLHGNSAQHSPADVPVKASTSDQFIDAGSSASTSATSSTMEQLKWQAGQGPSVELRLLVPGKVLQFSSAD